MVVRALQRRREAGGHCTSSPGKGKDTLEILDENVPNRVVGSELLASDDQYYYQFLNIYCRFLIPGTSRRKDLGGMGNW